MSPLALRIGAGALAVLALIALRGKRWAYFGFVVLGLVYFPAQAHFHLHVPRCEQLLPTVKQLMPLLQSYAYIALFAGFYWMSWVQLRDANARVFWALIVTLLAAVLFEIAEGMTVVLVAAKTVRHARAIAAAVPTPCRVQDLVPDIAGALGAAVLLAIWARLTKKPAYVRIAKKRTATAPPPAAPAPMAGLPRRAVVYDPPAYAPPPPPPDFSPGPTAVTQEAQAAPTQEVAPRRASTLRGARAAIVQRVRAILGRLRLLPQLRRLWVIIRGRRRTILVGLLLVVLVSAGAVVFRRLSAPASVVTAQPQAPPPEEPPPPPPRPLQVEVEGYYEPNYQFTVFDRRFTRVTLRPQASVRFVRVGSRQDVECADARISPNAVYLRCQFEPYGTVTIDGRFGSRYATSQLDKPVLSALITVTSARGDVVYRARDSFYWHVPDDPNR